MSYLLVLNPSAGAGSASDPVEEARSRLGDVKHLVLDPEVDLRSEIDTALDEDRIVVAAGGDGTINAVAQHLVGRGTMGVLPGGTLNHFCRDLGVRKMEDAFQALEEGAVRTIDVGRAKTAPGKDGGRYFVNNAGMGLYPEAVYERERHEHRLGKWRAAAAASLRVIRQARPLVGTIEADGDARALLAWVIFFGNNRFGTGTGRIGNRERLDEGLLEVRLLTVGTRRAKRSRMAWRVLRGRPWSPRRLLKTEAARVRVELEGDARLVSWDGEGGGETTGLEVEIVPKALRVIAPPEGQKGRRLSPSSSETRGRA